MSRRPGVPRSLAHSGLAAWLLASLVAAPPWLSAAQAAPKGEKVVKGKATFTREGDLTVIRTGKRAIIEYEGFDILSNETVRFEQPNRKSRVLNRVSGDSSRIDGKLQANGIVYIVNPAGVFFGRTAVVDVRRLVAAAGDMPDRKFLKQVDQFSLTGPVENLGVIDAQAVALLGRSVANHGSIVAPDGVIALVAGDRVVLTRLEGGISIEVDGGPAGAESGIQQTGLVDAAGGRARFAVGDHYSLAINHTGVTRARDIHVDGGDGGLVKVAGTLDASAPEPGRKGGSVRVTGELVQLEGALLDASGAAGGGDIRVGGDLRGQGPMRNARRTFVDADSTLRADALEQGDGGSAVVYADEAAGFFGEISARGGAAGGDGGFAELSSNALVDEGSTDLAAPAGKAGTLLYDPQDIVIEGGTDDGTDDPDLDPDNLQEGSRTAGTILFGDADDLVGPFVIHESEIEETNANIMLEARNSITASGTFDHVATNEGAGVLVIMPGNDFTARTRNQAGDETNASAAPGINLTTIQNPALEVRTSGDGAITLETGTGDTDGPEATITAGMLTTDGQRVQLLAEDGGITVNRITTSGSDGATNGANAGEITLEAGDKDGDGTSSILVSGDLIARGGNGTSGEGGNGARIFVRSGVGSLESNGDVTVNGLVDASGGSGPAGGGNGGGVFLQAAALGGISAADVTSRGGAAPGTAANSVGGNGGRIEVAANEGNIAIGDVDVSGGDTTGGEDAAGGGHGGSVLMRTFKQGNISVGDITTRAGDANAPGFASDGGNGGGVALDTVRGNIAIGAIDATGGSTDGNQSDEDGPLEFGGNGGDIQIFAGSFVQPAPPAPVQAPAFGDLTLNGNLDVRGGDNPLQEDGVGIGGSVDLRAKGAIEHGGQAGPHITSPRSIVFNASDVGALSPIIVNGGDTAEGLLGLGADDVARVVLQEANRFDDLQIVAYSTTADIQIVEVADPIIRIQNSELIEADSSQNHADMTLGLRDRLDHPNDVDGLVFTLRTGSIHAGGHVRVTSEDDIRVGDAAGVVAVMNERVRPPDPDADPDDPVPPTRSGALILWADFDGGQTGDGIGGLGDGVGKVIDGVGGTATGALDLNGDAQEAGGLLVRSRQGIGELGNPIGTTVSSTAPTTPPGPKTVPIALQTTRDPVMGPPGGGIYLRNDGAGDLTTATVVTTGAGALSGVSVVGGPGDIELENTAGDLVIERQVSTAGNHPDGLGGANGEDGTVTLRANPATGAVTLSTEFFAPVNAAGNITFDGPVHLNQNSTVLSRGGNVDFNGSVDTDPEREDRARSLIVLTNEVGDTNPNLTRGKITLAGDVGAANQLRTAVFDGDVVLEGGPRVVRLTNTVAFLGKIDAASDDGASLAIQAGPLVEFSGNIGETGRLSGLSIVRNDDPAFASQPDPRVLFAGETDQVVETGAGGISFPALAAIPDRAMVGKVRGGLTLRSTGGDVIFGQNQKLTAQGDVVLAGNNVQIGDVSALTIDVQAQNEARILTRAPGQVLLQSGGHARDEGADLVANEVSFSNAAPTLVGDGTVRVITPDGTATNAAGLEPVAFQRNLEAGDMVRGTTVLDLTALPTDLPNEVPQQGPVIDGIVPLRRSDQSASGSALPPGAEQTLAYLRCAASQPRDACDVVPASPLDSPRGAELAEDAAQFLGDSPEARARREALARLEPGALRELAVFMTEIRLLGLSESEYRSVRDALYKEILAGSVVAPDATALARAVNGQSRGVPL